VRRGQGDDRGRLGPPRARRGDGGPDGTRRGERRREEPLGEAVADARRKAELLAEAAGRRIARVHAVEEEERYHGVVALASSGDPDVRARDVTVGATVRVVFGLEDAGPSA
jgi:uncharacterized protein YggE